MNPEPIYRLSVRVETQAESTVEAWFWQQGAQAVTLNHDDGEMNIISALLCGSEATSMVSRFDRWLENQALQYDPPMAHWEDPDQWRQDRRQSFKAKQIGQFWLLADDSVEAPKVGIKDRILRVHPDHAFGCGDHATTQLILLELQAQNLAGKRVLDVGCGTGLLAIAAEKLGASACEGFDNDPECLPDMNHHLACNRVSRTQLWIGSFASVTQSGFDWVLANVTLNVHRELAPYLARWVNGNGKLMGSGVTESQWAATRDCYRDHGWTIHPKSVDGAWLCFEGMRS